MSAVSGTSGRSGRWWREMDPDVSRDQDKSEIEKSGPMESQRLAEMMPARPPGVTQAVLQGEIQTHLGRQLRAVYDEVATQPIPDRFRKLLEELEQKAQSSKGTA